MGGYSTFDLTLEPPKSLIIVPGSPPDGVLHEPVTTAGACEDISTGWQRSTCRSIDYPAFGEEKTVSLPDNLAEEQPLFSGFVRYEREYESDGAGKKVLELTDAYEGAELFVNGESLGIQIAPPMRWALGTALKPGMNRLRIEVATTLERETSTLPNPIAAFLGKEPTLPTCPSGISGQVRVWAKGEFKKVQIILLRIF